MTSKDYIFIDGSRKQVPIIAMKSSPVKQQTVNGSGFNQTMVLKEAKIISLDKIPEGSVMVATTSSSGGLSILQPTMLQPAILNKQLNEVVKVMNASSPSTSPAPNGPDLGDITVKPSKEFIQRHISARKNLRRQLERKLSNVPYPKTYRQVWPVIPVTDGMFLGSVGLEAVCSTLDPSFKSKEPKRRPSSAPKPVCQQCGSDFAPAWQVRKKNDSTFLLCEMCDFTNLKGVHREKISTQLKELGGMIKRDFAECDHKVEEDIQNQVKRSISTLYETPQTHQIVSAQKTHGSSVIAQPVIQSSAQNHSPNLSTSHSHNPPDSFSNVSQAKPSSRRDVLQEQKYAEKKKKKERKLKANQSPPRDHKIVKPKPKRPKHSTDKTLDKMLEVMKARAEKKGEDVVSDPVTETKPEIQDVVNLSDSLLKQDKPRNRKSITPKAVRRPRQSEVLPSTDPNSCIVIVDRGDN